MFRLKTSFRYAFSKTRGQRTTSIFIMLGIAIGLIALLVISAIMNGLQNAQLDQLRNLESFDLIIESDTLACDDIQNLEDVDVAFRFIESNILIVDKTSGVSTSARVRAFDKDILSSERMTQSFHLLNDKPSELKGLTISYNMMSKLHLNYRDNIQVTFLKPGKTATIVPYSKAMGIDCYYSSRLSEFSSSTVFMDYCELENIIGDGYSRIGVYINSNQSKVIKAIRSLDSDATIITWQEYNKALYSALMLEKTLMYIFLAFMFLIICVNLKNSTRRLLDNKKREGAMLRALGCTQKQVLTIFLGQGMVVSLLGETIGIVIGELLIKNLQFVLAFVDKLVYLLTGSRTVLTLIPFHAAIGPFEVLLICLFIFILSVVFTSIGCRRIFKSEIMEVILHASY